MSQIKHLHWIGSCIDAPQQYKKRNEWYMKINKLQKEFCRVIR
jgi:hypothetical protein